MAVIHKKYYYLAGTPGYIQDILYRPYRCGLDWMTDVQKGKIRTVFIRSIGCLIYFVSLPMKIAGNILEYIYRKPIHDEEAQRKTWYQRFAWDKDIALDSQQKLITALIKAKLNPAECPYRYIFMGGAKQNASNRWFSPDGRYVHFTSLASEHQSECLILGYISREEKKLEADMIETYKIHAALVSDLSRERDMDDLSFAFKFLHLSSWQAENSPERSSLNGVKWHWLGHLEDLEFLSYAQRDKIMRVIYRKCG